MKFISMFAIITFCLIRILSFTSSNEIDDTTSIKIVYKEINAERKITSITEKNLKYIDGRNAFHSENYIWDLASILYNRIDFNEVQDTGGKYCTIFGNINNIFKDFDPYLLASYLTNEELKEQILWHKSLGITDFASYKEYVSSLNPEVLERLAQKKEFTLEKQYEKIKEFLEFYKTAYENGSWILIHYDR